jgi:hypothetical protein
VYIYAFFFVCLAARDMWISQNCVYTGAQKQHVPAMRLVSIDIGIRHLALVEVELGGALPIKRISQVHLVDLTTVPSTGDSCHPDCDLHHSREIGDRLVHCAREHAVMLERAQCILVERQPITGLQSVQMFFHQRFRDKVVLLSPCQMHKFFNLSKSYQHRKVQVVAIMRQICAYVHFDVAAACSGMPRLHDVADAVCFAWWHGYQLKLLRTSPHFSPPLSIYEESGAFPNLARFLRRRTLRT